MSYITWRVDNEAKYVKMIEDDKTHEIPAFVESSNNMASEVIVGPVVDQMLANDDMTLLHFAGVFGQYLYETYHISPVDLEIFAQYVMLASLNRMAETAKEVGASMVIQLLGDQVNDEDEEDEE